MSLLKYTGGKTNRIHLILCSILVIFSLQICSAGSKNPCFPCQWVSGPYTCFQNFEGSNLFKLVKTCFGILWNLLESFRIFWNLLESFRTFQNLESSGIFQNLLGYSKISMNLSESSGIIQNLLESFRIYWDLLRSIWRRLD